MHFLFCVVFVTLSSQFSNAAQTWMNSDVIVYPGPTQESTQSKYGSILDYEAYEIPDECKDQTYCTIKPKNYPEERFNKMFNGTAFVSQPKPDIEDGIGNKQGDPDEKNGCESDVTFEPIYNVKATKGDWRTVIQSPKHNFVQKVRLENCKQQGAKCFNIFPSLPKFVTSCKQIYSTWELLVEGDNGSSEPIKVDLPICCSCVYKTAGF